MQIVRKSHNSIVKSWKRYVHFPTHSCFSSVHCIKPVLDLYTRENLKNTIVRCVLAFVSRWIIFSRFLFSCNEKFSVCRGNSPVRKRYGNEKIFTVQDKARRAFRKSAFNAIRCHLCYALRFLIFFLNISDFSHVICFFNNFHIVFLEIRKIFLHFKSIHKILL